MQTIKFTPGWPGMRFDVIPGKEDCETCRNTGWTIVHGAPRRRDGQPRFDYPCDCGRDPIKWLHDECVRKTASANKADMTSGR